MNSKYQPQRPDKGLIQVDYIINGINERNTATSRADNYKQIVDRK